MRFCVTVMLDVAVQPFDPVTVTVYVPGAVIDAAALLPNPPSQLYAWPPVAVTLIEDNAQVKTVEPELFVMPAVGAVISCVIVMLEVAVQPFDPVTVTVYVPGAVIDAAALLPNPPDQLYPWPPVAVTLIEVNVQVNTVEPELLVIPADGAVIS